MEQVLAEAPSRGVSLDAVFQTLKFEALDWAFDQQLSAEVISTGAVGEPATAGRG